MRTHPVRLACVLSLSMLTACAPAPRKRPVIVIGWDGADWQLLDELTARGKMPELAGLVREGSADRRTS